MWRTAAIVLAGVALAGGLFALGRVSADTDAPRSEGRAAGLREGRALGLREGLAASLRAGRAAGLQEGHALGLREGRAAGLLEGRALQLGQSVPRGSRHAVRRAFGAGYTAGANDVFGGFDGGWDFSTPYVITLRKGSGAITYRIDSRRPGRP